ncbi:MAG: hypothetical protein ACUVSQ_04955 [Pseudanabaenaceae cyanobacterium]
MPQPFRLFAPPVTPAERVLLVSSGELHLALPLGLVREVLVSAPIRRQGNSSTLVYQDTEEAKTVPVVLGRRSCPETFAGSLVLMQAEALVGGLLAIACTDLPRLAAVTEKEWEAGAPLPLPWVGGEKGYRQGERCYTFCQGLQPKT